MNKKTAESVKQELMKKVSRRALQGKTGREQYIYREEINELEEILEKQFEDHELIDINNHIKKCGYSYQLKSTKGKTKCQCQSQ